MHTTFTHMNADETIETTVEIQFTISKYRPARIHPVDQSHPEEGGDLDITDLKVVKKKTLDSDGNPLQTFFIRTPTLGPYSWAALTAEFEALLEGDKELRERIEEACFEAAAAMPVGPED